jgi:chlorobactene glucosyltransferase
LEGYLYAATIAGWSLAAVWSWRCARGLLASRRYPRVSTCAAGEDAPLASILVPARNEEANVGECLEMLLSQKYPRFEVIAIDDNSSDRTGELIAEAARRDQRLVALTASPTPPGWTGKNWALDAAARRARGEWLLFTDADTRHGPYALASTLAHASRRGLELLSLVPHALTRSFWERALQPPAMGYLGRWFPLDRINDPADPLAFANGQFLLFRREAYLALGGHAAVRGEFLEDVAFARAAKHAGRRMECALGKRLLGVRMYDSPARYFRGWHRIYLHAFDRKSSSLLARALDLALLSILPFGLVATLAACRPLSGGPWILWGSALGGSLAAAGLVYVFAAKVQSTVGQKRAFAVFHPLAAAILAGVLLFAARSAYTGAPTRWR